MKFLDSPHTFTRTTRNSNARREDFETPPSLPDTIRAAGVVIIVLLAALILHGVWA